MKLGSFGSQMKVRSYVSKCILASEKSTFTLSITVLQHVLCDRFKIYLSVKKFSKRLIGYFGVQATISVKISQKSPIYICRITLLSLPHSIDKTPLPSPIQCCLHVAKSSWNHSTTLFWERRGRIGLLNKGKRDPIEVTGGWKGHCVNSFVTDQS